MKPLGVIVLILLALAVGAGGGYWFGRHHGAAQQKGDEKSDEAKGEEKPTPVVGVTPIRRGAVSDQITAYGSVVAPPSEVTAVSVPFESRVTKMLVAPGEVVTAGQPLIEVEGSAATALTYQEAQNAAAAAQKDLELVRQRFEAKLATVQELNTAENNQRLAQGRLQSLRQGGAGGPRRLKSETPGIVSKVDVQSGQLVPAGNPLVEVAPGDRIEVKLSVWPADLPQIDTDRPVRLSLVNDSNAAPIDGKIRLIGQRVDPMTRQVDVMVALPPAAKLLLEAYVSGKIMTKRTAEGLIVPHDAVLPAESGGEFTLFTVKNGKAVKHSVKLGAENDEEAQIEAEDVKEGDLAVVVGNLELEDGMSVKTEGAQTRPATTEESPQTQPAATAPAATTEASQ